MQNWRDAAIIAGRVQSKRMGIPGIWSSEEEQKHLPSYQLLQAQYRACTQGIPTFDDGRNSHVSLWTLICFESQPQHGLLIDPTQHCDTHILTIVMPFGAYKCLMLPTGVMPATDIFQARMVHVFADMGEQSPFPYVDNILHFKGGSFEQHLEILNEIQVYWPSADFKSARRVDSVKLPWNS